jgi:hypothetical protein
MDLVVSEGRSPIDSAGLSHLPSGDIAIGTTEYLSRSICSKTLLAERIEISCSPERPPNITPMRVFMIQFDDWENYEL